MKSNINRFSRLITQNKEHAPAQAMLNAIGLNKKDMNKAQVGIGSVWYDSNPCNSHLINLVNKTKNSFNMNFEYNEDKFVPFIFNSTGVSDGISMGTFGMKYSLPSRELIADNFESICMAHHYDGFIGIPGCDKNMPGIAMAMCRVNRPSLMIYGGAMEPGMVNGKESDIVTAFEGYGKYVKGNIDSKEYDNIIENSCSKKCGACSGLYTANTMALMLEVMGLTLPNSASNPANSSYKYDECINAVSSFKKLMYEDIKPLDILTKESFINAIKMLYISGGSTNGIIHLLAIANNAGIDLDINEFNDYRDIPILLNMKPHGSNMMYHLHQSGGSSALIKYLIDKGIINGDCLTVTGETLKKNVNKFNYINHHKLNISKEELKEKWNNVVFPVDKPFQNNSHINILSGNIAPNGCITKIYGNYNIYRNKCLVFSDEESMIESLKKGEISKDNFIIIRGQGETTGCPEMLKPTSALIGYFGDKEAPPLLTDGRFSGGSRGILVAHLEDMYKKGSGTGLIENGDEIEIDLVKNSINLLVSEEEINRRYKKYGETIYENRPKFKGTLGKFTKYVGNIENGYLIE